MREEMLLQMLKGSIYIQLHRVQATEESVLEDPRCCVREEPKMNISEYEVREKKKCHEPTRR